VIDYLRSPLRHLILHKFSSESWYSELSAYISQRYDSIEQRTIDTFRYVDCHPANSKTFSYEFASILRDAGSTFSSVMDKLVRHSLTVPSTRILSIGDYVEWLQNLEPKIHLASAELAYPLTERLLVPFRALGEADTTIVWWKAYNDVKHSDIDKYKEGSLENALNSVAGLAVLYALAGSWATTMKLFRKIGIFNPDTQREGVVLFQSATSNVSSTPTATNKVAKKRT